MPSPIQINTPDELTSRVIENLTESLQQKSAIDSSLIDGYVTIMPNIDVVQSVGSFLPIINSILVDESYSEIDPYHLLVDLLEKVLSRLSFNQILEIYPSEYIIANLANTNNPGITKLCLQIVNSKLQEGDTVQFVQNNDVAYILVKNYLSNKSLDLGIVNQIELFVNSLILNKKSNILDDIIGGTKYVQLYHSIRKQDNSILLSRLLDFILILLSYQKELPLEAQLYVFSKREIKELGDDPLFLILLVQFYSKLIAELDNSETLSLPVFDNVKSVIIGLFDLYKEPDTYDFVKVEIIDVLVKLSYASNENLLEFGNEVSTSSEVFKAHNLLKIYEYDESDIKILGNVNPDTIVKANSSVYADVLSHLSLLNNQKYFSILLNFIGSTEVFPYLEENYFSTSTLSHLPADRLYIILLEFSKHKHSRKFLLNQASLTNEFLVDTNNLSFINIDLWHMKLDVLDNLIHSKDSETPELTHWKPFLQESYNLMKFGRNLKEVAPKVDVLDETM
ncbi:DNA mismatch repair protein HSM3 [Scheffersomyces xylosifermentans]|uniref:DNA mismatch repair protein HSM3 n=1 Tax=Scheffersomyces xylosifermentans TaxID=1304137 RepID=UPI00315D15ED